MITGEDLYNVLAAVVPLYVAMFVAYGSVRWWNIFTPDQCSGINRFVAIFAVPLLSFVFISENNPYTMDFHFLAADSLAKLLVLTVLGLWARLSRNGNLDWVITLFSLSTLPNTLVMGIPLLRAMYGNFSGDLMVQIVVLQCIIWYTLLLFLFEYRAARNLIADQFPDTAGSIVSFRVESDVLSLDGGPDALIQTDADVGADGKLHVTVRKSTSSRGGGMSSKALTPRPSNMTGFEIYSMHSSRNPTPRGSSFNHSEFYSTRPVSPSKGMATPRGSNFDEEAMFPKPGGLPGSNLASPRYSHPPPPVYSPANYTYGPRSNISTVDVNSVGTTAANGFHHGRMMPPSPTSQRPSKMPMGTDPKLATSPKFRSTTADAESKELHMFVWNNSSSPVSKIENGDAKLSGVVREEPKRDDFSFGNQESLEKEGPSLTKIGSSSTAELAPKSKEMPPATVITKLILVMVWRKLVRNPNTYSSLLGLIWSLVASRWNLTMPSILKGSVTILSNAGLGMAMFSLGLFMAMQPRLIACGNTVAAFSMAVKFLTGPAVMAAASIAIGIRGTLLHVAIVQAALPQGIVPFVFAKEYNVHPDILSTGVIFGMLVALPVTLLYYFLLGL